MIDSKELVELEKLFQVEIYEKGWRVCEKGEEAHTFYIVASGKLVVIDLNEKGEEFILTTLESDLNKNKETTSFGEVALLRGDFPRTATVVATETTELLCITDKKFRQCTKPWIANVKKSIEEVANGRLGEILVNIPFLADLPTEKLNLLGSLFGCQTFVEGETIFKQNDTGDKFFLVISGEVSISVTGPDGDEIHTRSQGVGTQFGEIALLDKTSRTATVVATQCTKLLWLGTTEFQNFLKLVPEARER